MPQMLDAVLRLRDEFSDTLKNAQQKQEEFRKSWSLTASQVMKDGHKLRRAGASLTRAITVPVVGAATASVKAASDFESAMTGVAKTVDMSASEFAQMKEDIRKMSRELPYSREEIAGVAEAAGQLGIAKKDVLAFSKVMLEMGVSTDMVAEEAATQLARFANITNMPIKNIDRLGATIVGLGNNFAATESEIVEMGMRIAAAGSQFGMSQADIMGVSAALRAVGIEAESGGTSFSKFITQMGVAVSSGGEQLQKFANVSGMSVAEFQKLFKDDAAGAFVKFLEGLKGPGKDAIAILEDMGIKEVRLRDMILRASGDPASVAKAIQLANEEWKKNSALAEEAGKRYETFDSKMKVLKNTVTDLGIIIGDILMPYITQAATVIGKLADGFRNLSPETQDFIIKAVLLSAAIGPLLYGLGRTIIFAARVHKAFGLLKTGFSLAKVGAALLNPTLLLVVAVLIVLIGTAWLVVRNWDKVGPKLTAVWRAVSKGVGGYISRLKQRFTGLINFITGVFTGNWSKAWGGISDIFESFVGGWIGRLGWLKDAMDGVASAGARAGKGGATSGKGRGSRGGKGGGTRGGKPAKHAHGTNFFAGGLTYINENRKGELVGLPRGTKIWPNDQTVRKAYAEGRKERSTNAGVAQNINMSFEGANFYVRRDNDIDAIGAVIAQRLALAQRVRV